MSKVYFHAMGRRHLIREMIQEHDDWYTVHVNRDGTRQQYWVSPSYDKPVEFRLANGMPIGILSAFRRVNDGNDPVPLNRPPRAELEERLAKLEARLAKCTCGC